IENLRMENTVLAWLLRGLGLILCGVGILLVLAPIQKLFSWIPILGTLTGGLMTLAAGLLAITLSLITISVAWIAVRPFLAISLLVVAGAAIYLVAKIRRPKQSELPQASPADDAPILLTDDMLVM
ncbi:MAG: TMEM43 family protein, partial [Planctomycetota bacterium]